VLGFWYVFDDNRLATKPVYQLLDMRERDRHQLRFFESASGKEVPRHPEMGIYDSCVCRLQESPAARQRVLRCQAFRGGEVEVNLDFDVPGRGLPAALRVKASRYIHCRKLAMRPIGDLDSIHLNAGFEKELTQFVRPIYVQGDHACFLP
jgi:hypothetical protein